MTEQLSTEDYQNIYLRIKEKLKFLTFSWISFLFIVFSVVVYLGVDRFVKETAKSEINELVRSPQFRKTLMDSLDARMAAVDASYKGLITRLSKYETMSRAPYSVTANGFSFVDTNGTRVILEYGQGKVGQDIVFRNGFHSTPLLLFSSSTSPGQAAFSSRIPWLTISKLTDREFVVANSRDSWIPIAFNWVAIGK